ncbi:hypothetical protein B296_00009600, partial [Ensete ventricosum]
DLAQVRSTPLTCKRTPHCQDGKHGERHDDMVEGAAACAHRPGPASACSLKLEGGTHPVSKHQIFPYQNLRDQKFR